MLKLGEIQSLKVAKLVTFGAYLTDGAEEVLLPIKQVPEKTKVGDVLEVFLYLDSEDRPIATVRRPALTMGGLARLRVGQVNKNGAFLNWGLEKDLFLPFREQTFKVKEGDEVLVTLYSDKSGRLCATMNVYEALLSDAPYAKDGIVTGTVYQISENFGAFVAVDDKYSALIPKREMYGAAEQLRVGREISARVSRVLPDGRLELSVRAKGEEQRGEDAQLIERMLKERGGRLDFGEKSSPEVILRETGMSKAQFKRALGKLLKEGKVELRDTEILYIS